MIAQAIIKYNEKTYQVSRVYLEDTDMIEVMVFPIENGIVSGSEVFCYRTDIYEWAKYTYEDIKNRPEIYLSEQAIKEYLATKEDCDEECNKDCNEECDTYNLNLDIIGLLNEYVNEIAKTKWCKDECPPKFVVSIFGDGEQQKILLTVSHLGYNFSEVIFPKPDATYGYETIEQEMTWLYNRTM